MLALLIRPTATKSRASYRLWIGTRTRWGFAFAVGVGVGVWVTLGRSTGVAVAVKMAVGGTGVAILAAIVGVGVRGAPPGVGGWGGVRVGVKNIWAGSATSTGSS